jgi:hypothetical protein
VGGRVEAALAQMADERVSVGGEVQLVAQNDASRGVLRILPHEPENRVICSGAVRRLLRTVFGETDWAVGLPLRDDETSPAALLRGLYGRRRW